MLNDLHRPLSDKCLLAQCIGHHTFERLRWAPKANDCSHGRTRRPLGSIDSAAVWIADNPDAASVSRVMLGPFIPKQKETRLDAIAVADAVPA
mmetsp:Transcript_43782/g.101137  ORF Transcript_43782/g.101137 Transcript_43782/m.101137 type:complete len:93 (+) Transcript_43782:551-829(+)